MKQMKRKRIIDPDARYLSKPTKDPVPSIQFNRLEKHWYGKLQASGFNDIEDHSRRDRPLKAWHTFRFKYANITVRANCEEYFNDAKELLHTYKFKNDTHKRIWELHAQGFSKRKIEQAIKHLKKRYRREQIGNIIRIIAKEIKVV